MKHPLYGGDSHIWSLLLLVTILSTEEMNRIQKVK